jgi:hypothetical protein
MEMSKPIIYKWQKRQEPVPKIRIIRRDLQRRKIKSTIIKQKRQTNRITIIVRSTRPHPQKFKWQRRQSTRLPKRSTTRNNAQVQIPLIARVSQRCGITERHKPHTAQPNKPTRHLPRATYLAWKKDLTSFVLRNQRLLTRKNHPPSKKNYLSFRDQRLQSLIGIKK